MRDKVSKIVRVESDRSGEPRTTRRFHSVYFESLPEQRVICTDEELALYRLENELLEQGHKAEDLLNYRIAVEEATKKEIEEDTYHTY